MILGLLAASPAHVPVDQHVALGQVAVKALFPIAAYLFLAPVLWFFFRRTWRELDLSAHEHQKKTLAAGTYDYRPAVLFVITALVLTLQEYYGGRDFYTTSFSQGLK